MDGFPEQRAQIRMTSNKLVKRTNREATEWITYCTELSISERQWQIEAEHFFGFAWNRNTFNTWKTKFVNKNYAKKRETTAIIMKNMGGKKGKQYLNVPPADYFPGDSTLITIGEDEKYSCSECSSTFITIEEVKDHMKKNHEQLIMKNFRTDAGNKVSTHEHYISWMNENCNINVCKEKQNEKYKTTIPKMQIVLKEN